MLQPPPDDVWADDRLVARPSPIEGSGLFATEDIAAGTIVLRLGGELVDTAELHALIARSTTFVDALVVGPDTHLVLPPATIAHYGNHSCDPTLEAVGPYEVRTRRDVRAGEELTLDYAPISDSGGVVLECHCGAAGCRGRITGKIPARPRRALPEDAAGITAVWLRSRRASVPAIPPPVHTDDEVASFFAGIVLPERETWVVDHEGSVVALLVLEDGWVDQLYVDPDHTGRGVGTQLLDLAKQRCPGGLDLWTFTANTGARRFYERHGFVEVDSTDGDNEEGAPDVRYRWPAP